MDRRLPPVLMPFMTELTARALLLEPASGWFATVYWRHESESASIDAGCALTQRQRTKRLPSATLPHRSAHAWVSPAPFAGTRQLRRRRAPR